MAFTMLTVLHMPMQKATEIIYLWHCKCKQNDYTKSLKPICELIVSEVCVEPNIWHLSFWFIIFPGFQLLKNNNTTKQKWIFLVI